MMRFALHCAVAVLVLTRCGISGADATLQLPGKSWTARRSSYNPDADCARVATITEFRAYAGGAPCVVLTHAASRGRFNAGGCSADDGGVCVRASTGTYYLRPLGTPHVWHTDYYIAASATDQSALAAVTYYSRLDTGAIVIFDRVYDQTDTLNLYDNITYRGGGLRRSCQVSTVLTADLSPVGTTLEVESTSGFSNGRMVFIAPSNGYEPSIWASSIVGTPADATHMTINAPLGYTASAGWRVSTVWQQIRQLDGTGTPGHTPGLAIDEMEFDGNAACNTYVHDWRYQDVGAIKSATVTGVYVHDTPAEAFTICGTTLRNSRFVDLAGSAVHKSCGSGYDDTIDAITTTRTNKLGDALLGHSEGTITLSANAGRITLTGSAFTDGAEGVFGLLNGDDAGNVAIGNTFVRHARWCSRTASDAIDIENNTYVDTPRVGGCP